VSVYCGPATRLIHDDPRETYNTWSVDVSTRTTAITLDVFASESDLLVSTCRMSSPAKRSTSHDGRLDARTVALDV